MLDITAVDKNWTLFIDRDGVINHEKYMDYIHTWDEFVFYDNVTEAFRLFNDLFKYIIVVTNQKGVGKGLTKADDLDTIHKNMELVINEKGGRIDAIYFSPDLDDDSPNRKPNPGMGLQALERFPDIDVNKAMMVGNKMSDMEFGRNLGIHTVYLTTTHPAIDLADKRIDAVFNTLDSFAQALPAGKL